MSLEGWGYDSAESVCLLCRRPWTPLSAPPKLGVVVCTCEVEAGGSEVLSQHWLHYLGQGQLGLHKTLSQEKKNSFVRPPSENKKEK